jgi:serine protease
MRIIALIVLTACIVGPVFGQSREYNGELRHAASATTDQVIVKWRSPKPASATASSRVEKLRTTSGLQLRHKGRITADTDVLKLEHALEDGELAAVLAQLSTNPEVEYAVANQRRQAHALPNDPLFTQQWYLQSVEASATRAEQAWDITVGSNTTVVAVLDTGVRFEHPDLGLEASGGKLLAGYDFIGDPIIANDGDGADSDASDPGDWVSTADRQLPSFTNCDAQDSSWHGTRVSSLIGALTNEAQGMAGKGWSTVLLPVRVLGKCGGFDSDIIMAMRWAAGLSVPGVPANSRPAKIINMSLGSAGACSAAYQSSINEILSRGVLIVVSAGNEGGPIEAPANCSGVLAVTGLRHAGTKVGYSNLGPQATIGAPAGNCVNAAGQPCLFSILAATNSGTTAPLGSTWTDQIKYNTGTSFSAPLVAGAAALMHAINAQLRPANYITLIRESALPFATSSTTTTSVCHVPASDMDIQNTECICTTQTCGAGMLDTHAAVLASQRPFAIAQAPGTITAGTDVTVDGRGSFAANARNVASYQWSVLNVTGATPAFASPAQAMTTLQVSGSSQFTLRLTITDDQGAVDTADMFVATPAGQLNPAPAPTIPPSSTPPQSHGGGGGNMSLLLLGLIALRPRRR